MPLLEVTQTRQVSASIRLTETVAMQTDQYAAYIHACADDVVEQALAYIFTRDKGFQEFQKTSQAKEVPTSLRIRKVPATEAVDPSASKPANGAGGGAQTSAAVAGSRA
jgi:hypothetical protein